MHIYLYSLIMRTKDKQILVANIKGYCDSLIESYIRCIPGSSLEIGSSYQQLLELYLNEVWGEETCEKIVKCTQAYIEGSIKGFNYDIEKEIGKLIGLKF